MSVTTKFGIIFLLSPFLTLASFLFGVHYFYEITPDLFPDLIPALISTILVVLLVWERLRESLRKDLRWFHKYVLFKLYNEFGSSNDMYFQTKEGIKRLRADLEEYGRSMGLRLYPGKLPKMIDKFLELHERFYPKHQKIREWGEKELGKDFNFWLFFYNLEMFPYDHSSSSQEMKKKHEEMAQKLSQEQPELVNEARDLLQRMRVARKQIHDLLDDFIKDNKLRLEPEPVYTGYNPFR